MSILYFSVPYAIILVIFEGINWKKLFARKRKCRYIEGGIDRYPDKIKIAGGI